MKPQLYIGIDTGVNTGICIYVPKCDKHKNGQILYLATVEICRAMQVCFQIFGMMDGHFAHTYDKGSCLIRVEDARLRNYMPASYGRERLQGVGSVKRDGGVWQSFCETWNVPFELVAPKDNTTKLSEAAFKSLTHYSGKSSEHARDATMLVFGY